MALRVRDAFMRNLHELRYEPVDKRIRGILGEEPIVDTRRAMLVWEPKRVVPRYAVPAEDISAELSVAKRTDQDSAAGGSSRICAPRLGDIPVLDLDPGGVLAPVHAP